MKSTSPGITSPFRGLLRRCLEFRMRWTAISLVDPACNVPLTNATYARKQAEVA